jgi:hypothetical protein
MPPIPLLEIHFCINLPSTAGSSKRCFWRKCQGIRQTIRLIYKPTESSRTAVYCTIYMYIIQLRSDVSRNINFSFV